MSTVKLKVMLLILTAVLSSNVIAKAIHCAAMDSASKKIDVLFDDDKRTLNMNGTVLKIEPASNSQTSLSTEQYNLADGGKAYISIVMEDNGKMMLHQMNAANDKEISNIELACDE